MYKVEVTSEEINDHKRLVAFFSVDDANLLYL